MDKRQVDELVESREFSSVEELTDNIAVPEDKDMVVEFEVEAGTKIRASEIGEAFGGEGGLRQFEPRSDNMLKDSENLERTDFPGTFRENNPISEVFDINS